MISNMISYMISHLISCLNSQVEEAEKELKMKIRPRNAFFSCYKFAFLAALPREELHQFLIGLYGEYIIPSAFHLITSVLRKQEFILSRSDKGATKYLVTNDMLGNVWIRLRDRLSSLDSSTSLIEVTTDYAAHFYDMYVEGHTGKHLTGDRIRILLLNLPFLFRDLIAPEVIFSSAIVHNCSIYIMISYSVSYHIININAVLQIHFVNDAIRKAQPGSKLHDLDPIVDPSDEIIEVLLSALRWDMQQRRFGLNAEGLDKLHGLSVELLEVLKENMPDRTGGPEGWNFEKAHSILHKVRDILLFGWSENFSHQGPEHGHIDNCKKLANCTNNKEVYLTVLRAHAREGHLQYLRSLEADLADAAQEDGDGADEPVSAATVDNECKATACDLGIRYPTLQSIYAGKLNKQSIQVNIIYDIIFVSMISLIISYMINRCRAEKPMLAQQIAMHTIIIRARSAWTCIFSSLPVWMSFRMSK
jgi:hypothetical protein